MGFCRDNTKELEAQILVKEQAAIYEKDKSLLAAEVTDDMRKIDLAKLQEKLEAAKGNGLSKDWYVRLDRAINELKNWFYLEK